MRTCLLALILWVLHTAHIHTLPRSLLLRKSSRRSLVIVCSGRATWIYFSVFIPDYSTLAFIAIVKLQPSLPFFVLRLSSWSSLQSWSWVPPHPPLSTHPGSGPPGPIPFLSFITSSVRLFYMLPHFFHPLDVHARSIYSSLSPLCPPSLTETDRSCQLHFPRGAWSGRLPLLDARF